MDKELAEILANSELDDNAKAEAIKQYVGSNFVPTAKLNEVKQEYKNQLEGKDTQISGLQESLNAKMTDEEKQQEIIKQAQETHKQAQILINRNTAKEKLLDSDISKDKIEVILDKFVSEDAEKTKQMIEILCGTMKDYKQGIEEKVKNELLKQTKPPAGDGAGNGSANTDLEKYKKLLKQAEEANDYVGQAYYTRVVTTLEAENNE